MSKKALLWLLAVVACLILADAGCSSATPSGARQELTAKTAEALTSVTWTHALGVSVSGNSLTKTGAPGWNAGATSNEYIVGPGSVTFTTAEANTNKVVGLAALIPDSDYQSIDFGLYLHSDGTIWVSEGGDITTQSTTYVGGDVFTIEETGSPPRIQYLKNGTFLYESHYPPYATQPYVVNCSPRHARGHRQQRRYLRELSFREDCRGNDVGVERHEDRSTRLERWRIQRRLVRGQRLRILHHHREHNGQGGRLQQRAGVRHIRGH